MYQSGVTRAGLFSVIALSFTTGNAQASDLAAAATDPIADLIQFQIQNIYTPKSYHADGYANTFILQPVVPFKLPWTYVPLLVTRTTLPYVTTPKLDGVGRVDGFGDLNTQGYFVHEANKQKIGLGYNLTIPTAGDNKLTGAGKWSLGPSAIYFNSKIPTVQWGVLAFSSFSFASARDGSDRPYVSNIGIQPIFNKHFDKGWYLSLPDVVNTYDFRTNNWILALGPRLGKVTKFGKQPVNLFGEFYFNPIENDDVVAPKWTFKASMTLLFPK